MDLPSINIVSIASGGGGLDLGVEAALHRLGRTTRHVAYVEIEAYACAVLASRMEEGNLAAAPIWTNLRTFDGRPFAGLVDLLVGGYPCQPFSLAGKRRGADDPRHLWPAIADLIRACRPGAVFFENVAGHLSLGAREVLGELQDLGYRVAAGLFTAEEIGAPHKRERLFILGVADAGCIGGNGIQSVGVTRGRNPAFVGCEGGPVDDADSPGCNAAGVPRGAGIGNAVVGGASSDPRGGYGVCPYPPGPDDVDGWRAYLTAYPTLEPAVRRGSDGLADHLDRLRLLGNGVVPDEAYTAFLSLTEDLAASYGEQRSAPVAVVNDDPPWL